jgi:uncharacterized protein with ParB-like and HNH nuclease domain
MKPEKLTIYDLFIRERRYVVPLYQRAYVWTEQSQWEPLWEDIERLAEASVVEPDTGGARSHFLGAIVLNVAKIVGSGVARSEVIDGQQRLTTLQLFLAALRDYAVGIQSQQTDRLRALTLNPYQSDGSETSFKVWPTNADRNTFRTVLTSKSPNALLNALGVSAAGAAPLLAQAYFYFFQRIADFVGSGDFGQKEVRLLGLTQALRTALQLVVIELESHDDPQVIFETLNARGQPLLPSDLIRNYIFMQTSASESQADAFYDRYWRPFDDLRQSETVKGESRFWHVDERQGRLTRPRIDLFLFHYLVMKRERELNIGQLFREFKEWREAENVATESLLADLKAYSELFSKLVAPAGYDRIATFAKRLKSLDNSTVYPLLLYVLSLNKDVLPIKARDQILADLESWLVRRFICQLTNKNYNNFFASLLAKVKKCEPNGDISAVVRSELSRSVEVTGRWPADEEFRAAWLSKPLYAKSRPDRSAMVLAAIEAQIRTAKNEAVTVLDGLSVEHLLPQKGELSDYPFANPMPLALGEVPATARERLLHTVGNLTLLTVALNSSVSNGPFLEKTEKIVADSDLRLNAWLRTDPPKEWSEHSIVDRGIELFKAAVAIWSNPNEVQPKLDWKADSAEQSSWQFTDAASLAAKRQQILNGFGELKQVEFISETAAKHRSVDGKVRAAVAVSKRYEAQAGNPYWYGYHLQWDRFLNEGQDSYFVLGCMDIDTAYVIPKAVLDALLPSMHTTKRAGPGQSYWHIHLAEKNGQLVMLLPKGVGEFDLTPYKMRVSAAETTPA